MRGALNRMLSSKSSMPPMPGKNFPESFTPASRLNSDSIKSPMTAQKLRYHTKNDRMQWRQRGHVLVSAKMREDEAGPGGGRQWRPPKPSQVFPGLMRGIILCRPMSDPTRVSPPLPEFCNQDEIQKIKTAFHSLEEIDFLDEIKQPGNIHQPEESRGNGKNTRRVVAGHKLADAQTQHKQN